VDVLCADYHAPSILFAAWKIARSGLVSLPEAVRMVTLNPAHAIGLGDRIGSLAAGKQADIAIVDPSGVAPAVQTTFRAGVPCYQTAAVPVRRPAAV
jgi:alpha-D-ribose 1-methylphosphonate 5-triphosphate diphosphatase